VGHADGDLSRDERDSAAATPKCVVVNSAFKWGRDRPLRVPWDETIIYETHVKGLTMRHPDAPKELQGTYAGLAHPAIIDHLRRLGVTAVELLPIHHFVADRHLVERGLTN
jgi:glycogen operon protein